MNFTTIDCVHACTCKLCCCNVHVGVFGDPGDVERLLEMGTQSLREGHLSDALLHYHAAIGKHALATVS